MVPWFTAPHRYGLEAAATGAGELGSRGVQPDAFNGRTRRRLSALALRPRGSRPFFRSLFLPFSTVRALVRLNAKTYSSLHSHFFVILHLL